MFPGEKQQSNKYSVHRNAQRNSGGQVRRKDFYCVGIDNG